MNQLQFFSFLSLLTYGTSFVEEPADKGCTFQINLEANETKPIRTVYYPKDDPGFMICRWTVTAPVDHRILFACPNLDQNVCTGTFSVYTYTSPKVYCNEKPFFLHSNSDEMRIEYRISDPEGGFATNCIVTTDLDPEHYLQDLYRSCDYHIPSLEPEVTVVLRTINHPNFDPWGTNCRWSLDAPVGKKIKIWCPLLRQEICTGFFRVSHFYDSVYHCNDVAFEEYSSDNLVTLTYNVGLGHTNEPGPPVECFAKIEDPPQKPEMLTPDFYVDPYCDKSTTLKFAHKVEYIVPWVTRKHPQRFYNCRWRITGPVNTRLLIACPTLHQEDNKCSGNITVYRLIDPKTFCNNKPFFEYSDTNTMIVTYKMHKIYDPFITFHCTINVEPPWNICQCGRRNPAGVTLLRLLGGENTGINEFPMMAALRPRDKIKFFCGATIIAESYAVTAAICVMNKEPKNISLTVGEHDRGDPFETWATEVYEIDRIVIHEGFKLGEVTKGFAENDIALVRTKTPIRFSTRVGPACLPFARKNETFEDAEVISLGWGKTGRKTVASRVLQKVKGFVYSDHECVNAFSMYAVKPTQMCVLSEKKSTCKGDAGGPVLWENTDNQKLTLIAIHSTARLCSLQDKPSVKTRVTFYLDWIFNNAPDASFCME